MQHFKKLGAVALMTLTLSGSTIALNLTDVTPDIALERIDLAIAGTAGRANTAWSDLVALTAMRDKVKEMVSGEIDTVDITAHLASDDTGKTILVMDMGGSLTNTVITSDLLDIDDAQPASASASPGASDLLTTVTGMAAAARTTVIPHVPRAA